MEPIVIKDFLSDYHFNALKGAMVWNSSFPLYLSSSVSYDNLINSAFWHWYAAETLYLHPELRRQGDVTSSYYKDLVRDIFVPKFSNIDVLKDMQISRVKVNFYPHTWRVREHGSHTDVSYGTTAAIFGLNTCNGFTRVKGSGKIKSVANQLLIFDGLTDHNSSTTSNAKGRFNINFNFI